MNKTSHSIYLFLCVTLISILIVGIYFYGSGNEYSYTLKEYNGKIAVFINESTEPVRIIDTNINVFPSKDKESLKNGITVYSDDELHRLIEDFSG